MKPFPRDAEIRKLLAARKKCGGKAAFKGRRKAQFQSQLNEDGALELLIYDVIGYWGIEAIDVAETLRAHSDAERLVVRINSPGGDVFDGVAIFNSLLNFGTEVDVEVDGLAASAASLIAMAGDTIRMGKGTRMMIHRAWTVAMGNEEELCYVADVLRGIDGDLVNAYVERSGGDAEHIRELVNAETWLSAQEAVDEGLADEVMDAKSNRKTNQSRAAAQLEGLRVAAYFPEELIVPKSATKPTAKKPANKPNEEPNAQDAPPKDATPAAGGKAAGDAAQPSEGKPQDSAGGKAADSEGAASEGGAADNGDQAGNTEEPQAVAATFEELSALAGDDSDFIVAQLSAKATLGAATAAYIKHVKDQRDAAQKQAADAQAAIGGAIGDAGEETPVSGGRERSAKDEKADALCNSLGDRLGGYAAALKMPSPSEN